MHVIYAIAALIALPLGGGTIAIVTTAFLCGHILIPARERISPRSLGWLGFWTTVWRGLCVLPRGWAPIGRETEPAGGPASAEDASGCP
ncbi:hypothetical protein [Curtobacterium sp. S6]|uniref:hypothetical protein n=1 Tax=Curtobacterium sp. S6 TaxID=1479623 RepID=UPI0004ABC187|nr:hypothetical protein [Curtobacterium sp. S6]